MSFFRLTAPRVLPHDAAETETAQAGVPEGRFTRMIRLWVEYNMRVAQLRMMDR